MVLILGDTTCGQRALYEIGMTGIPIYNVCISMRNRSDYIAIKWPLSISWPLD